MLTHTHSPCPRLDLLLLQVPLPARDTYTARSCQSRRSDPLFGAACGKGYVENERSLPNAESELE